MRATTCIAALLIGSFGSIVNAGQSPISIPFVLHKHRPPSGNIASIDRNRASAVRFPGQFNPFSHKTGSVPAVNAITIYQVSVDIGQPSTNFTLFVDTGSSTTWVGAGTEYVQTKSSVKTGVVMQQTYGTSSPAGIRGDQFLDTVSLGHGLTVSRQAIANAAEIVNFDGADGVLGLGPTDLTLGVDLNDTSKTIPTFLDNLYAQRVIPSKSLAMSFVPSTATSSTGQLTFGGVDSSKFVGPITYTPFSTVSPANRYYGLDMSLSYGSQSLLKGSSGMVDSGTSLLLIATDAFQKYQQLTGGIMDPNVGLLAITPAQYRNLKSMFFDIGGRSFEFTPNAQIWPRSLNNLLGANSSVIYLITSDIGSPSGSGLDFFLGYVWMERFYTVLDSTRQRVGFANTLYTFSGLN